MKQLIGFALFLVAAAAFAQDPSLTAASDAAFQPVNVKFSITISPDDPQIKAAKTFSSLRPTVAVWNWGEHKKVDHADLAWPQNALEQTVSHVYAQPGDYVVSVTVLDEKHRLMLQQSVRVRVNAPVDVNPKP